MDIKVKIEKSQPFRKDLLNGIQKVIETIEGHQKAEEEKKKKEFEYILEKKYPKLYKSRATIISYSFIFTLIGFLIVFLLPVIDIPEERLPVGYIDYLLGIIILPIFVTIITTIASWIYMNLSKQRQKIIGQKIEYLLHLKDKIKF